MGPDLFDRSIFYLVSDPARLIEDSLRADVVFDHGRIHPA